MGLAPRCILRAWRRGTRPFLAAPGQFALGARGLDPGPSHRLVASNAARAISIVRRARVRVPTVETPDCVDSARAVSGNLSQYSTWSHESREIGCDGVPRGRRLLGKLPDSDFV